MSLIQFSQFFIYFIIIFKITLLSTNIVFVTATVDYIGEGIRLMRMHLLDDALNSFNEGIRQNPTSPFGYIERSLVYELKFLPFLALHDLSKALDLYPESLRCISRKGKLLISMGRISEALKFVKSEKELIEKGALRKILVSDLEKELKEIQDKALNLEKIRITIVQTGKILATNHIDNLDQIGLENFLIITKEYLEKANMDFEVYYSMFKIEMLLGNTQDALKSLENSLKFQSSPNTDHLGEMAVIELNLGSVSRALDTVRKCLRLDESHEKCSTLYKKLRVISRKMETFVKFVEKNPNSKEKAYNMLIELIDPAKNLSLLFYYIEIAPKLCDFGAKLSNSASEQDIDNSIKYCDDALNRYSDNFSDINMNIHCNKGELYLAKRMFDEALKEFNSAGSSSQCGLEGRENAERMKAVSTKRDYYAILQISPKATDKEIKKAFRSLAAKYHPDRQPEEMKEEATAKFKDITDAKDVLTDPDMRAMFDSGIDPLDPSNNKQYNPFTGGGGGFSGDPFAEFGSFFSQGGGFGNFNGGNFNGGGGPGGKKRGGNYYYKTKVNW